MQFLFQSQYRNAIWSINSYTRFFVYTKNFVSFYCRKKNVIVRPRPRPAKPAQPVKKPVSLVRELILFESLPNLHIHRFHQHWLLVRKRLRRD